MTPKEHELIVLQMLREIKARGTIFSGNLKHVRFLLENNLVTKQKLREVFDSNKYRVRYTVTAHGEGMVQHLVDKYEKGSPDGECSKSNGSGGSEAG